MKPYHGIFIAISAWIATLVLWRIWAKHCNWLGPESDPPRPKTKYLHYKGGIYEVLHLATHTETGEPMVVYYSVKHNSTWARPVKEWTRPLTRSRRRRFSLMDLA